jgi:hypothetical protein
MTDPETQLLAAANRVRAVQELEPLRCLVVLGAEPGDESGCVLAQAMQCAMGGASDPAWAAAGRWVLRFHDRWTARIVALELGREWHLEYFEVEAPELLVDLISVWSSETRLGSSALGTYPRETMALRMGGVGLLCRRWRAPSRRWRSRDDLKADRLDRRGRRRGHPDS